MTGLSLQAWEVIAELIGAIGLIFSLLFVGFQIRFAVKANRMERMNQQLEIVRDQALQTAISPDLARILVQSAEDYSVLTAAERMRFSTYLSALAITFSNTLMLRYQGLKDPELDAFIERNLIMNFSYPAAREWANRNLDIMPFGLAQELKRLGILDTPEQDEKGPLDERA